MQGVPVNRLCTLFVSNSDHRSLINRILVTGKNASSSSSGCTKCTTHSEGSAVGKSQPIVSKAISILYSIKMLKHLCFFEGDIEFVL